MLRFILIGILWFSNTYSFILANQSRMKNDLSQANDSLIVSNIYLTGNDKTKAKVILNELPFKSEQWITKNEVDEYSTLAKQNLLNTSLFNFVYIYYWLADTNNIIFEIKVDERWYIWALPIFEQGDRNFSSFIESKDWSRINYGFFVERKNFRGLNETFKVKIRMGFLDELELYYTTADKNNHFGWGSHFLYHGHNQVSYKIVDNEPIYAKTTGKFIRQTGNLFFFLRYRHHFFNRHHLACGYNTFHIADTLAMLNQNYLPNGKTSHAFFSLRYSYNMDKRDSKIYPLKGYMYEASVSKIGLGLLSQDLNTTGVSVKYQNFGSIYPRLHYGWYIGNAINSTDNNPSYIESNGVGFGEFLNGYEYNVIEGNNYFFSKQKVSFELIPSQTRYLNFINLKQFNKIHYALYIKTLADVGYVGKHFPDSTNSLTNTFLYSYGIGVDLVTYYDKVFSFNYSVNKFGTGRFYFHLNVPI
jgi:outer membrane protein assembly factor BamA